MLWMLRNDAGDDDRVDEEEEEEGGLECVGGACR